MAKPFLKQHMSRGTTLRPQRRLVSAVRTQAASSTTVSFKIHRRVDYGQSLLVVGSSAELGSWDAKHAVQLNWGEGDNWTTSLAVPPGTLLEYKYIIKRSNGLDWCPGQNKSVTLPAAAAVQISDSWDNPHNTVSVLTPAALVPDAVVEAMAVAAEAPIAPPPSAAAPAPSEPVPGPVPPVADPVPTLREKAAVLIPTAKVAVQPNYSAVSTVENIEMESSIQVPAPSVSPAAQHQQPPGFLANNIVQAVPIGVMPVGQDPITLYEEADRYQVVEVSTGEKAAAQVAEAEARPTAAKSLDSMTVAELKNELRRRGMSSLGTRRELIIRLQKAGAL